MSPFALLLFCSCMWLISRAWKLAGRAPGGPGVDPSLRIPIRLAAGTAALSLLARFTGDQLLDLWVLPLTAAPLICLFPGVGRRPGMVALLATLPALPAFSPVGYFILTNAMLIFLAARGSKGGPAGWDYRAHLLLIVANAVWGILGAGLALFFYRQAPGNGILLLGVFGVLPALCLIPSLGKKPRIVILMNSLALIPVLMVPVFVFLWPE